MIYNDKQKLEKILIETEDKLKEFDLEREKQITK